jgi:plastocyanin
MRFSIQVTILLVLSGLLTAVAGDIKGKIEVKGAKHAGDAVIYIDNIDGGKFSPPKKSVLMDQKNLTFIPHVLPVMVGTTVEFLNSDDVLHNVFTPDKCAEKFNLGSWPKGQKKEFTFNQAGCNSVLLCNVHPEMEAYILVVETPYFAVTDKEGKYELKDVPAGEYNLRVWHERLRGKDQTIKVPAKGSVTAAMFKLKR